MIKTERIKLHKEWKTVKQIDVNEKLEKDLEDILSKLISGGQDNKNGEYKTTRRSIFRKKKD